MKQLLCIIISVLLFSCKAGKKVKEVEKISNLTAQNEVLLSQYKLNENTAIRSNFTKNGYWFFPMDPNQESYLKIENDSSVTLKNLAVNVNKEDKTETKETHRQLNGQAVVTTDYSEETNINRHSTENTKSQIKDFKGLITSLIILVIALIGYALIRKFT